MYDTSTDLAALSQQSGARYLSLAFLETAASGSCTAYWDGDTTQPIAPASYGADIADIQAHGGNVIPSFGGYTADTTNTDIADSCTSVPDIAKVYESLITTYNVPRIDLDVEADSLTNTAGINRRNEAIALTEAWAAAHHRQIQFSYTLPTFPTGLTAAGLGGAAERRRRRRQDRHREPADVRLLLRHAAGHGGRHRKRRGRAVQPVAVAVPDGAGRQLWHMIGVTEMPGIDDFGTDETFSTANAVTILNWARHQGIGLISFWALQRDNGGCLGTKGAGTCSGVSQPTWYFSHVFEHFTS